ncbi:Rpn family recombination-promoting nuclease/putative transposase [Candidatus Cetobacterium colombiensis]|uniref:Rpn family recombination-promoting nuclease/putative transposase n=1 Tax=Candidatus Cetobacterium colombiensis TaxID=3073100 RepID=A0ABU4WCB6_9FUSO|nr:Rpn family recombination-promoting nuclease/putative transposase [Candidatus Cetobacterium colombiensis]MDX8337169.1 Rpn family recombination-promoting nuclease/putative transposase [Candidatus Cetobacterium colombiensis]
MCTQLFDPKVDYVFKNIFGSEKHPRILISFLNACIKPKEPIVEVKLKNTELTKEYIEDSFSRLDILAKTSTGELINIEMQRADERNMVKRSLYYWSKAYISEYTGKGAYANLPRTICINVLDFILLEEENFHNKYLIQNAKNNNLLTDTLELHFIEIPKMKDIDESDLLSVWVGFLENPNNEKVISLERKVEELQEAKEELARISRDPKEAENYRMRENARNDRLNALLSAEEKGIAKGIAKGIVQGRAEGENLAKINIAKGLIGLISDELIAEKTGLSVEEIKKLK